MDSVRHRGLPTSGLTAHRSCAPLKARRTQRNPRCCGAAQKDTFRTDSELERKLCVAVLAQLDDVSGDISGLAVKWWAPRGGGGGGGMGGG